MKREWWKQAVFYQIYPRSFCDSNGDGIGDISGIISKLSYIQELGIDAIWLSPVYTSPNHDNGYDISDYFDINPEYGTLDDMKKLIAEAKTRNIRIIMDLVINHTSDEHPWFIAAQDPHSPYRDYYIWKDARRGRRKRPPNNWVSYFGGSTWQWHETSEQYYLHLFSPHQPDLNFHNPAVIEEVKKIMRFWLDMGVAGFRCDTINMLYKTSLKSGRLHLAHLPGVEHYFSQPGCHRILQELYRDVLEPYGAFAVGESGDTIDIPTAKQFVTNEMSAFFTFDHLAVDRRKVPIFLRHYKPERLKAVLIKWQEGFEWNTLFFENHDTRRSVSRFGASGRYMAYSATLLATLLLTLKGMPFIYQGQEIGMQDYPFTDINQVRDASARNIYALLRRYHVPPKAAFRLAMMLCRDHARTPMQWDGSAHAGFTSGVPWMPVNPAYVSCNVNDEKKTPKSIYSYYHSLIALRQANPALQYGEYVTIPSDANVFAYSRQLEGQQWVIVANMGATSAAYPKSIQQLPNVEMTNYHEKSPTAGVLRPYEVIVGRYHSA